MSIPERFYRIAKHKFSEIKDRVDRWDEEAQAAELAELRKPDARAELKEALRNPTPAKAESTPAPTASSVRSPEEIRRTATPTASTSTGVGTDLLAAHYRLLGVEPGADFAEVQAAYNKLAARCDPARFPANSTEAREAELIRKRLEDSYKALRDALDSTARRFDLLEFDTPAAKEAPAN